MNITDALYVHARERPEHPAVEDGERIISYSTLAAMVDHAANRLQVWGIEARDIVVIALPDTAEHVAALFALANIGAVSFSLDERLPEIEKAKALRGLAVKAAIIGDGVDRFLDLVTISIGALFEDSTEVVTVFSASPVGDAFDGDAPLMVIQSSGTTGEPKRLLLTHWQMAERNRRMIAIFRLNPSDRFLQVPYLRFSAGRRRCFTMIGLGGTVVLNQGEKTEDYLRYFSERGITYVFFTPFHLRSVLSCVTNGAPLWPKLKIVVAGAPLSSRERLKARQQLTPQLFETYGTNEVGDIALAGPDDQDRYPDSTGRLIAGIEAQVVDDNGSVLRFGETGQIRVRGPHFPREYMGNLEETARHFRDGWFYPGDLAALNEEGYVFLKGRIDDVINNAGVKYFPAEVEAVLLSHPAIVDAAVVGGPHAQFGEVSVAYVVRSSAVTPNELYKFCKGKIAMYKAPQWVFFLNELPRVVNRKADKKTLKETFRRYLEAQPR